MFEVDPFKGLCSAVNWSQFTNPCILPNNLSSDLANKEQSLPYCYSFYFLSCVHPEQRPQADDRPHTEGQGFQ